MKIPLAILSNTITVDADESGIVIASNIAIDWAKPEAWPQDSLQTRDGMRSSFEVSLLLEMGLAEATERLATIPYSNRAKSWTVSSSGPCLNGTTIDEAESARGGVSLEPWVRPRSLREDTVLKQHQQAGVQWLQTCSGINDRQGVLLADDMGLGKTLQILTFLAWAIESGRFPDLSQEYPPYRPILVVAPLILLETRTWEREIERFFANEGHIFGIPLPLYGPQLKAFCKPDARGREDVIGEPILDLDRIRKYKLVLTNYEAVRDYEFSFARYTSDGKSLWSIVITDEAQEYKTPNTKISHAIKAIRPDHPECRRTENRDGSIRKTRQLSLQPQPACCPYGLSGRESCAGRWRSAGSPPAAPSP